MAALPAADPRRSDIWHPYEGSAGLTGTRGGRARDLGVNYIGVCCGGAPHQVRAMAEALGRQVPASRYAPAMELHPILGVAGAPAEPNVRAAWNVAG